MSEPESRVLEAFRAQYVELRDDLAAFDRAFRAARLRDYPPEHVRAWCSAWWEARLGERILLNGERRLRGTQGLN